MNQVNHIKVQQENIKELMRLVSENPELEIIPMVDSECIIDDDFSSWAANWGKPKIDEYYVLDRRICFLSEDYDRLVEDEADKMFLDNNDDRELYRLAREKVDYYDWVKAIVVDIEPL
jgi:hypothetical protein